MHGEWVFEVPGHGKGPCNGIGASLKRMLGLGAKKRITTPTVKECVDYLWAHTESKPLHGRYAHFTKHKFEMLPSQHLDQPSQHTIPGTTELFHWKEIGKPGKLLRRKDPCMCDACRNSEPVLCWKHDFFGKWPEVIVKAN